MPPILGLGDAVALALTAVGVQPCAPCQQRQARLNRLVPFRDTRSPVVSSPPEEAAHDPYDPDRIVVPRAR